MKNIKLFTSIIWLLVVLTYRVRLINGTGTCTYNNFTMPSIDNDTSDLSNGTNKYCNEILDNL